MEHQTPSSGIEPLLSGDLDVKKHVSFFIRCLRMLPTPYTSGDGQRMTLGYFALSGLDLLGALPRIPTSEKEELIAWVYTLQSSTQGGFKGSPNCNTPNIAATYSALLILGILRDDFSRLDRLALLRFIRSLQATDGSFAAESSIIPSIQERDPRFSYCAIAIADMLDDWSAINVRSATEFLMSCQRYDGGFGASPTEEAHSGMTYCSTASLCMLENHLQSGKGREDVDGWTRKDETVKWLIHRQVSSPSESSHSQSARQASTARVQASQSPTTTVSSSTAAAEAEEEEEEEQSLIGCGFQGRPSKLPPDVCYSFWNGGSLAILGGHGLIDSTEDARYLLSAQSNLGGIAKFPNDHPDLLHSYLGLASLALHEHEPRSEHRHGNAVEKGEEEANKHLHFGLRKLDPTLNCSIDTKVWIHDHLRRTN